MTEGKVAAQVAHAVIGLGIIDPLCTIVVLPVSDKKFFEFTNGYNECYTHRDFGYSEVDKYEPTSAAWVEYFE